MLRYGTLSWKLLHVIKGFRASKCVNVPCACVLKMMLWYGKLSWKLLHATIGSGAATFLALAFCRSCYATHQQKVFISNHLYQHGCWHTNSGPFLIEKSGQYQGGSLQNGWPSIISELALQFISITITSLLYNTSRHLELQRSSIKHRKDCWKQTDFETRKMEKKTHRWHLKTPAITLVR